MKSYRVKIVDAFTKSPFSGNPAGVVLDAGSLTDPQMQAIARELNLSETAFIMPARDEGANLQIRWFTPSSEVPLCGHATIAAFHAMAEDGLEGMNINGQHYFRLQTKKGVFPLRVEKNFYETTIEFELPVPKFKIRRKAPVFILRSLGIGLKDLAKGLPIVTDIYLYLPVKDLKIIKILKPEYKMLEKGLKKIGAAAVCVFSLQTKEKNSSVHSRFFAPGYGINEDPVTGSANGPLACYIKKYVLTKGTKIAYRDLADGRIEFIGEQGDEIGRKGRVKMRVNADNNIIKNISIAGEAVTILESKIKI